MELSHVQIFTFLPDQPPLHMAEDKRQRRLQNQTNVSLVKAVLFCSKMEAQPLANRPAEALHLFSLSVFPSSFPSASCLPLSSLSVSFSRPCSLPLPRSALSTPAAAVQLVADLCALLNHDARNSSSDLSSDGERAWSRRSFREEFYLIGCLFACENKTKQKKKIVNNC